MWKLVTGLAEEQNTKLQTAHTQTKALLDRMTRLEAWIARIQKDFLAREYTVHSYDELVELDDKFKVIGDSMHIWSEGKRFLTKAHVTFTEILLRVGAM